MEDMDIDHIVEIPDTPDRPAARHVNSGDFGGKERKSSVVGCLRNFDFKDEECLHQQKTRGRLINENGNSRRHNTHHMKSSIPKEDNQYASRNASLFRRRTTIDKNSNHETRNSIGAQHMDRGKQIGSKFPYKSSAFQEDRAKVDLTEANSRSRMLDMAFPRGKMKDLLAKEIREGQTAANGSSSHWPPSFPIISGSSSKGKEKLRYDTSKGADSHIGHRKVIDPYGGCQPNTDKQMYASCHSSTPSRGNRQKRLVRNGFISPLNIEIKAKQLDGHAQNCSKDVEQNQSVDAVSSGPCTIDISDIVAEDKDHCIPKGTMMHPCTLKKNEPKIINLSNSPASNHGEVNGNGHVGRWRSMHSHSKKVDHLLPDSTGLDSARNDDLDQISKPFQVANTVTKRQKKHESTSNSHGQSSRTISHDSDIVFLDSSGESSWSRSSRIQRRRHQGILDIDDFSPEMRNSDSQGLDCANNDDSDDIRRQLEADEMFALELQEQLYHESPVFGSGEIDENLARLLQQEEVGLRFSDRNHHGLHSRTSSSSSREPRSRLLQNALSRRGSRAQDQNSSGVTQFRNRFLNRSRTTSSRRNFQFPLEMDLDMRLDILEAFEAIDAAGGDFFDMEPVGHVSQLHREFNENDYEMLLALDENNHQSGASANLINSLPLSTVQNDNFEEACAICLDTPTIGDSIRHLPCLHKFHKECIDPWLNRKSSCPVCKSSIT